MAEPEIAVVVPTADDTERLVDLFMADMRDLGHTPERPAMRNVASQMLTDDRCHIWVARRAGRIVGVVAAIEMLNIKFPGRALWIEELYVDPIARRSGLGRVLVEHLLDFAEDNGFAGVELEAYRMNTAASILYRSLGFQRLARERYSFEIEDPTGQA